MLFIIQKGVEFFEKLKKQLASLFTDVNDFCTSQKLEFDSKKRLMDRVNSIMSNNNNNNNPMLPFDPSKYSSQIKIPSKFTRGSAGAPFNNNQQQAQQQAEQLASIGDLSAAEVNNIIQSFQTSDLTGNGAMERPKLKDFLPFMKPQSWGNSAGSGAPQKPRLGPPIAENNTMMSMMPMMPTQQPTVNFSRV